MITFICKSAVCLTVLYGFYHLFLRNLKAFYFNRYYLLFSLLFSTIISLNAIQVDFHLPVNLNIYGYSNQTNELVNVGKAVTRPIHFLKFQNILIILYSIISIILLSRFTLNIYKILKLIRTSSIVDNFTTQIVLVDKKTLPYSFFKYIFLNRSDHENGKIRKELLIHEQSHCLQYHSLDIIIVELIKIILWFNPFVWLFGKAIQLNHEYLADKEVLSNYKLEEYQNTLVNLVLRNNSTYLASNFNYALTKKRLIMMKKERPKTKFLRIIVTIPLFLILTVVFANTQNPTKIMNGQVIQNYSLLIPPPAPQAPAKAEQAKKGDAPPLANMPIRK